jgi:hypothetical protein
VGLIGRVAHRIFQSDRFQPPPFQNRGQFIQTVGVEPRIVQQHDKGDLAPEQGL